MFRHRAWVPLLLIVVLHTMTARGEEDEPWEDLFNGKDFKGWKDAKHARFAKAEAVIAVPPLRPSKSPRNNQIGPAECATWARSEVER